jgi:enoyl-CoA hydratase/carnithine racemase
MSGLVEIEERGPVAIVYMSNPPTNSLQREMVRQLLLAMKEAAHSERVRVITLASKVRYAFSSGLDLKEIYDPKDANKSACNTVEATESSRKLSSLITGCGKPVIAAINGIAFGSGFTLALACDFRVCSEISQFRMPDVQYGGLLGDGGIHRLRQIAGQHVARELLLLGEKMRAERAHELGVVDRLVAPEREIEEAYRLAEILSRRAPKSLALYKKILAAEFEASERDGLVIRCLDEIVRSSDTSEGLRAFAENRKPNFEGK